MKNRWSVVIVAVVVGAGVLGLCTACGGGGDDGGSSDNAAQKVADVDDTPARAAGGSGVTVTVKEFAFDPKEIKLEAGNAVTIVLKNVGAVEHDFTVDGPGFKVKALPTKTEQAQLTIPAAGSYVFYCSVPGHRQAGMEGTVTVA